MKLSFTFERCFLIKSRYLTNDEIEILSSALDPEAWLPFELAFYTGLRIGDVLKIRNEDIKGGVLHYIAEKTGKPGTIKLPKNLCNRLCKNKRGKGWVFPSPQRGKTNHLTRQAAWARFKKAASSSGVDLSGCSPHSLRKSFAVELYKREGSDAVKEALQHSNIRTTELYALSDFISGENAKLPLLRADLPYIVERVAEAVLTRLSTRGK